MSIVQKAKNEVQFIAEIGKNFIDTPEELSVTENLNKAIALVKAAKNSGADAVKFQTHVLRDEILNKKFRIVIIVHASSLQSESFFTIFVPFEPNDPSCFGSIDSIPNRSVVRLNISL